MFFFWGGAEFMFGIFRRRQMSACLMRITAKTVRHSSKYVHILRECGTPKMFDLAARDTKSFQEGWVDWSSNRPSLAGSEWKRTIGPNKAHVFFVFSDCIELANVLETIVLLEGSLLRRIWHFWRESVVWWGGAFVCQWSMQRTISRPELCLHRLQWGRGLELGPG